jgi:antiviral helicase SKI2
MSTIPIPPFPSPQSELEEFLLSPHHLPIHHVVNDQKLWPRQADPYSLMELPICPTHSNIIIRRDAKTGALLDYCEVKVEKAGLTPKNSTSLQRAPAPSDMSIKGDPAHFPFWPGGLDEPKSIQEFLNTKDEEELDFEENLLTTPPGLLAGVDFTDNTASSSTNKSFAKVSLQELFNESGIDINWLADTSVSSAEKKENADNIIPKDGGVDGDVIDNLVEGSWPNDVSTGVATSEDREWAIKVDLQESVEDFYQKISNMAHTWPFELDAFQKQAILRLESQDCVFVAAHTSAGKTVVAEYAIAMSLSHKTKTIYTSPIKALSNQKFHDFRQTFNEANIGLVTGDVQIRKEAPCLIMTTEILRSMLYHGSDIIRDVEWVIFDEVHYINDSERGVVWEEVLIMLPDHVGLILLSATVPNSMQFADWVGRTKRKKIYVISTSKRPVPLQHFLYTGNSKQTQDQLYMIVDENRKYLSRGYKIAMDSKKDKEKPKFGAKGKTFTTAAQDKNVWLSLINMLQKKDKLPLVAFTFSRNRCDVNADMLTNLDLTDSHEKHKINSFFQKSISILKGSDRELPQVLKMKDRLKRGIGVHHSGILPIIKEIVELLFGQGLVRLLFATETFAMGVNMPARTVAFDSITKHDGLRNRELYPGEYVQMAGRAGRRGKDTTGTVIIVCKGDVPEEGELSKMILGTPTTLESQFRLTYTMLLNILRVQTLRVEDMMMRSFAEMDSMKNKIERKEKLEKLMKAALSLSSLMCPICMEDIKMYYESCDRYGYIRRKLNDYLLKNHKILTPGRLVIIDTDKYNYSLSVILQHDVRSSSSAYKVLMLCNQDDMSEKASASLGRYDEHHVRPYRPLRQLFVPEGFLGHNIVSITCKQIVQICKDVIQVNGQKLINDHMTGLLPRFKDRPPSVEMVKAIEMLRDYSEAGEIELMDSAASFNVKDLDYMEMMQEMELLHKTLPNYSCLKCPDFSDHFEKTREKIELEREKKNLKFQLSEKSLLLMPEYHQKLDVLKKLQCIDHDETVKLKGRVACEIHTQEIIITEILFRNALENFTPAEIAALLSSMVFQQDRCSEPNLTDNLKKGKDIILMIAQEIAEVEKSCGLNTSVDDYQRQFKFGLVEVVYEWANGKVRSLH